MSGPRLETHRVIWPLAPAGADRPPETAHSRAISPLPIPWAEPAHGSWTFRARRLFYACRLRRSRGHQPYGPRQAADEDVNAAGPQVWVQNRSDGSRKGKPMTGSDSAPAPTAPPPFNRMIQDIAARGDREAFAALFKHFAPRLKTFLMRSGLTPTAAEEVAQETMLSVWRKASYFDPSKAGAATWIFTIARNLKIDAQRRDRPVAQLPSDADETPDDAPNGEALVLTAEREERVRAALTALSAEQAHIVRLSFFQDKPHAQIAEELGIPLGTAKSRVRLALGRLRTLLDDLG